MLLGVFFGVFFGVFLSATLVGLGLNSVAQNKAYANPTSQPTSQGSEVSMAMRVAREQIIKGELLQQQGRYTEAIEAFKHAQRLHPDLLNLITIATLYDELADCASAYEAWMDVVTACTKGCEFQREARARFLEKTAPCTSTLSLSSLPSAEVTIDGREVGATPLKLPVLHGSHTLTLSAIGHALYREHLVTDESSAHRVIDITLKPQWSDEVRLQNNLSASTQAPRHTWRSPIIFTSLTAAGLLSTYAAVSYLQSEPRELNMKAQLSLGASGALTLIALLTGLSSPPKLPPPASPVLGTP